MKKYIRVQFVGEKTIHLGVHGELTPGSEISLDFKEVQYLEKSKDGWPKYLKAIKDSESDTKLPKKIVGVTSSSYKEGQESTKPYDSFTKGTAGTVMTAKGLFKGTSADVVAKEQEELKAKTEEASKSNEDDVPPYEKWDRAELLAELAARKIKASKEVSGAKAAELLYADDKKNAGE